MDDEGGSCDMKDVPIQDRSSTIPSVIERNYAFVPASAKLLSITAPTKRPPLLYNRSRESDAVYDMGTDHCGRVSVSVRIRSPKDHDGTGYDEEIPLKLLPYKTAEDPKMCYNLPTCRAIDKANEEIENHNRYLTLLISMFVKANGCGTSAGHVTLPPAPTNMTITRTERIGELMNDKFASVVLAVRYLEERSKVCQKDYEIEDAVEYANDVAFQEDIEAKIQKWQGRVRFRIVGSPPATWSGRETDRDSIGRRVKWSRDKHHTFISPCAEVVLSNDEIAVKY